MFVSGSRRRPNTLTGRVQRRNRHFSTPLLARLRYRYLSTSLTRRRFFRQTMSIALALGLGYGVFATVSGAEEARRSWGTSRRVVVASHALRSGEVIEAADLRVIEAPEAMVPEGAFSGASPGPGRLAGRRLRSTVDAGEMLTQADIAPRSAGRLGAVLGDGDAVVTVSLPTNSPPVEADDIVDVYGTASRSFRPTAEDDSFNAEFWDQPGGQVERLARSSRILRVTQDSATLMVAQEEVSAVLGALTESGIYLVMTK